MKDDLRTETMPDGTWSRSLGLSLIRRKVTMCSRAGVWRKAPRFWFAGGSGGRDVLDVTSLRL